MCVCVCALVYQLVKHMPVVEKLHQLSGETVGGLLRHRQSDFTDRYILQEDPYPEARQKSRNSYQTLLRCH